MRVLVVWFLSCLALFPSFAQNYPINRQVRGIELPSEVVYEIQQDEEGQMWFNTGLGVYFSDGFSTISIPDTIQTALSSQVRMFKGKDGGIWLYNKDGKPRVFKYQSRNWNELKLPKDIQDNSLPKFVFSLYHHEEEEKYLFIDSQRIYLFFEGIEQIINLDDSAIGKLHSVFQLNGVAYLFYENQTKVFDGQNLVDWTWQDKGLPDHPVRMAYDKNTSEIYFLGNNYLAKGKEQDQNYRVIFTLKDKSNYNFTSFSGLDVVGNQVYFHNNSQLQKYSISDDEVKEISSFEELRTHLIYCSFVDRENILWIGSHRGLANINSLYFSNYNRTQLLDDEVTAIIPLDRKKFLIGFNNGIQVWEEGEPRTLFQDSNTRGFPDSRITNFYQDKHGIVWFSSNLKGLGRFDPETEKVSYVKSPLIDFVNSVHGIGDSLLIVADYSKIFLFPIDQSVQRAFAQEISSEFLSHEKEPKNLFIRKIGKLRDGRFILLHGGEFLSENEQSGISNKYLIFRGYDYLELDEDLLIGTETGLYSYSFGELSDFEFKGKTIKRSVFGLLKDRFGRIWAGTDHGVFLLEESGIRNFVESSGIAGLETNRGALIQDFDGNIWIGTFKGLTKYNPKEDKHFGTFPFVGIDGIHSMSNPSKIVDGKKISFSQNNILIPFKAVTFLQDARLVINYKLEGLHENWIESNNPRENVLSFTNLPPGKYKLQLKASVDGANFTEPVVSPSFTILKPFYLQGWFLFSIALILLGIGYLISSLLTQNKMAGFLKNQVDEKNKVAMQSEDQFKNVWNSSRDGLMIVTDDGKVVAANESMAKLAGLSQIEIESGFMWNLFTNRDFYKDQIKELVEKYKKTENNQINEELSLPFKGGVREIDYYATLLQSDFRGRKIYLSVFRDITEKKIYQESLKAAKEKAEHSNKIKSSFLSNISHEIRTPLNGILGTTENILLNRKEDKALVSQLEIIQESGERLLKTINSILDLSKIESSKFEFNPERINLNEYLAKLLLPLKSWAVKKGVLISAKYRTEPFIVNVDARYFEMVVNNVVGNAIKYSDGGLVTVKLGKVDDQIELEVLDQGIGMTKEFLSRLFEPFEQESKGYGRIYEGTGLGLAITKNLIELMEGSIKIESEKNKGTRVHIILPIKDK
jgi:PAS domain S-box-containing protein